VARTGALGLTSRLCYHPQLPELADLLRAHPDQKIVLNHLGGPLGVGPYEGIRAEVFAQWSASMRELAKSQPVRQTGRVGHEREWIWLHHQPLRQARARWHGVGPYMETAIEAFGSARCMFESNFPVDKGMCAYPCCGMRSRYRGGCSAGEKADLFHGSAARFYSLPRCNCTRSTRLVAGQAECDRKMRKACFIHQSGRLPSTIETRPVMKFGSSARTAQRNNNPDVDSAAGFKDYMTM